MYIACLVAYIVFFTLVLRETRGLTVEEAAVVYDDADVREKLAEEERRMRIEAEQNAARDSKSDDKQGSIEEIEYRV